MAGKMIWWPAQQTMLVADLHLGKTGHFRKEGIAVPQQVYKKDLHQLFDGIQQYKPQRLIIAGDMFHSRANKEMDLFIKWRQDLSQVQIQLVRGNHDILHDDFYKSAGITVDAKLCVNGFTIVHDLTDADANADTYHIAGHMHPAISIHGGSRQHICLPCFYFGSRHALLPAFSAFSGHAVIRPRKGDTVVAIANNKLVPL